MDGAAASPQLQLFNLKVLSLVRPSRVLELGSGQSTKVLSAYAKSDPSRTVMSLEQSEGWVKILSPQVDHEYVHAPLHDRIIAGHKVRGYQHAFGDQKFDYILVDGPDSELPGTAYVPYSRAGIVEDLPKLLAQSFVLVFDDAERPGERDTVGYCELTLRSAGIQFRRFTVRGIKHQAVLTSPDLAWLASV